MLTPAELYPLLERLLQASHLVGHATARSHVARLLVTLLVAQDARPSALIRILPASYAPAARQRYAHVRRGQHRPGLTFRRAQPLPDSRRAGLDPRSGPGARRWRPRLVALDSVRCGPWEIFTSA